MTAEEMLARMSSAELTMWMAEFQIRSEESNQQSNPT